MGRLLCSAFDNLNPFRSRKPSDTAPCPSFCNAETKAPFLASYNSITTSTPRLPRGSTEGPASAYSGSASTSPDTRWMKYPIHFCNYTCVWLVRCQQMTRPFFTSISRGHDRLQLSTKPDSVASSSGYKGLSTQQPRLISTRRW
jgi:hypothetical protein